MTPAPGWPAPGCRCGCAPGCCRWPGHPWPGSGSGGGLAAGGAGAHRDERAARPATVLGFGVGAPVENMRPREDNMAMTRPANRDPGVIWERPHCSRDSLASYGSGGGRRRFPRLRVVLAVGGVVAALVALAGGVVAFRSPVSTSALHDRQARRHYGLTVGVEFTLAGVGAAVLAVAGQSEFIPVWICAVVGVALLRLGLPAQGPAARAARGPDNHGGGAGACCWPGDRRRCEHGHRDRSRRVLTVFAVIALARVRAATAHAAQVSAPARRV